MRSWIEHTIEWQHWGWNAVTVSFVVTVMFTLFQAWGLWQQDRTIRRLRSGEAIAVLPIAYIGCVFLSFLCYGVAVGSVVGVVNGALGFFQLRVLASLYRFKVFTRAEKLAIACFPTMIAAMLVVPWKNTLLLVVMAVSLLPMAQQPLEIWRRKTTGAVDIRYVAAFTVAAVFGTIYAFTSGIWVLMIINPGTLVILATTAVLWLRYRPARRG